MRINKVWSTVSSASIVLELPPLRCVEINDERFEHDGIGIGIGIGIGSGTGNGNAIEMEWVGGNVFTW